MYYNEYVKAIESLGYTVIGSAHAWARDYAERVMLIRSDASGRYAINSICEANGYGDELESAASAEGGIAQEAADVIGRMEWVSAPDAKAAIVNTLEEWESGESWVPSADENAREEIAQLLSSFDV